MQPCILSGKGPKGRCFAPDKLENQTIEGKGKNKQIERAKSKKGGGKKKAMVAPVVLTFSTLEIVFWQKNAGRKRFIWQKRFQKCSMVKKKMLPSTAIYLFITIAA